MSADSYIRFLAALIFVVALIGALAWCARRFGWGGALAVRSAARARGRRLGLIEILPIDPRRKLVLVSRDGVEHLLLLGTTGELVVESGINTSFDAAVRTAASMDQVP